MNLVKELRIRGIHFRLASNRERASVGDDLRGNYVPKTSGLFYPCLIICFEYFIVFPTRFGSKLAGVTCVAHFEEMSDVFGHRKKKKFTEHPVQF